MGCVGDLAANRLVVDALNANIAVLDGAGRIIATNRGWDRFADENGAPAEAECFRGCDYFEVCRKAAQSGCDNAVAVAEGIRRVMAGSDPQYSTEYPCDSPTHNRWFVMHVTPLGDRSGGVVVSHTEITERRRAEQAIKLYSERLEAMVARSTSELAKAQEELLRNERLAMLGQFAGSVGHELRNPLGVISNAVYYLQSVLKSPDPTTSEYLEMIAKEVRNSEKIIRDLLELSRNRPAERRPVSVQDLVSNVLLRQSPAETVKVVVDVPESLERVYVDERQMVQVIENLVSNAMEAMPDGGILTLSAVQKADGVVLSVADTGTGIPKDLIEKIYDPLVTTKRGGIGLGLTLSRRLVELNNARLHVASLPGNGSTFSVTMPVGG